MLLAETSLIAVFSISFQPLHKGDSIWNIPFLSQNLFSLTSRKASGTWDAKLTYNICCPRFLPICPNSTVIITKCKHIFQSGQSTICVIIMPLSFLSVWICLWCSCCLEYLLLFFNLSSSYPQFQDLRFHSLYHTDMIH